MRRWRPAPLYVLLLAICVASAGALAQSVNKHMGVASCSSNVCHGKLTEQTDRNVALNEYRVWSRDDYHSRAYKDLSNQQSQGMAAKLGLPNAATAKICLDCHADNVAAATRGPKFQLSDGVSCEACHGGAEKWVESHTQKSQTHKENVAQGMYPTEQPLRRAELCVSCHMGTRDKLATHEIMAAGHPRLRFEMEVFTFNQPAHVVIDEDYVRRKGRIEKMNLWITGQLENARRYLELLQTRITVADSFLPEFALYDCFGCHHPLDKQRWTKNRAGAGIQPGTLRVQKYHLTMLEAITEVLAPDELAQLTASADGLVRAGQKDVATLQAAALKLHSWIDAHDDWTRRQFTPADIAKVRKAVIRYAAEDRTSDFGAAEQVVMCMDTLSYAANDHDRHKDALKSLYDAVGRASAFDPSQFAGVARSVQGQF